MLCDIDRTRCAWIAAKPQAERKTDVHCLILRVPEH
jgi:hypothetical protein